MFLTSTANPLASYLSLADLKADTSLDLTDRNGVALSDVVLNAWLEEHSGTIDTLIGQSYLPQVETRRIHGEGSTFLHVGRAPIIYVKQVKIVLPNSRGFDVPVQSLLIDSWAGVLENMTPLTFQGVGITTLFPNGTPIDVTVAYGIGYPIPAPLFTATYVPGAQVPIPAGTPSIGVSAVTVAGESLARIVPCAMPSDGSILLNVTNSPGALKYYVYRDGVFVTELQGYAIGSGQVAITFDATPPTAPPSLNVDGTPKLLPIVDTSAIPFQGQYSSLRRLTKLLIQQSAWEAKNPSNQGVYQMQSGLKRTAFKDNLNSIYAKNIDSLIESLKFSGIV